MLSDWLSKGYVVLSEPVRHKGKPVCSAGRGVPGRFMLS